MTKRRFPCADVWQAPRARENPQKCGGLRPPTDLKAFPGPRGRPDLKKEPPTNPARLPSGTQFDFDRKYGWVLRVPVKAGSLAWALGGEGL